MQRSHNDSRRSFSAPCFSKADVESEIASLISVEPGNIVKLPVFHAGAKPPLAASSRPATSFSSGGKSPMYAEAPICTSPFSWFRDSPAPFGDPSFGKATKILSIEKFPPDFVVMVSNFLVEQCTRAKFIAAAAIQFKIDYAIFVYKVPLKSEAGPSYVGLYDADEEGDDLWRIVVNPSWVPSEDAEYVTSLEGSFGRRKSGIEPFAVKPERPSEIIASWYDAEGIPHTKKMKGLEAKLFINKTEYCDGAPIADSDLSSEDSLEVLCKLAPNLSEIRDDITLEIASDIVSAMIQQGLNVHEALAAVMMRDADTNLAEALNQGSPPPVGSAHLGDIPETLDEWIQAGYNG